MTYSFCLQFHVTPGAGFPDHPHRGMSTVTYMLQGSFEHADFTGRTGRIDAGDLQFMTAGRGIAHAEMPVFGPGLVDPIGLQLWVDLPSEHKMTAPTYQELKASEIPTATPAQNVSVQVICGESLNESGQVVKSPVRPMGGCWIMDVTMTAKSATVTQRVPAGWNAFIYTLTGDVRIGSSDASVTKPYYTSVLSSIEGQDHVSVTAESDSARFVFVAGAPLDQKVFQYGPMVMDSEQGIRAAFSDYQEGKNGFEGAAEWRSEISNR